MHVPMGKSRVYTREALEPAAKASTSVAGVLRFLGRKYRGGNADHCARVLKRLQIDTSHFTGSAGAAHRGGAERLHWTKVLVLDRLDSRKEHIFRLRRAMVESGIEEKCGTPSYNLKSEWLGKRLRLQIEHRNGNCVDNRRENLMFLCPNCHSQTATWGRSKARV